MLDTHLHQEELVDIANSYNYFYYRESEDTSKRLKDRVIDMCSREIISDVMSTSSRVYNIYGLNLLDLMDMDFASYEEIEQRMDKLFEENRVRQEEKLTAAKNIQKDMDNDRHSGR